MNKTGISWTDYSLNPLTGCSKISEGCENCYAKELYERHKWDFNPTLRLERLKEIKKIPAGTKVFLGSVTDIFHDDFIKHAEKPIDKVMDAIESRKDVIFQILTKRPWNATKYFLGKKVPDNIWLGTTVESKRWLVRIDYLKAIDVKVRFLSCEPLLEDLTAPDYFSEKIADRLSGISWIIVGAESGGKRRPFDEQWARNLRDLCRKSGTAFFYKQGSDFKPGQSTLLDGIKWHEFPNVKEALK